MNTKYIELMVFDTRLGSDQIPEVYHLDSWEEAERLKSELNSASSTLFVLIGVNPDQEAA